MTFEVKHSVMERAVTRGDAMMEHAFFCNVWSHVNDPFSEPFQDALKNTWLTVCPGL